MERLYVFLFLYFIVCCPASAAGPVDMLHNDMLFVENRGQLLDMEGKPRPDILFSAEAPGMKLYCRPTGISYVLTRMEEPAQLSAVRPAALSNRLLTAPVVRERRAATVYRMDVEFVGAAHAEVSGREKAEGYFNYYYAHCPEGVTDVGGYKKIVYSGLYPGIDLVLYAGDGGLKYDFIVHPGGDPDDIRLKYRGADELRHTPDGVLEIATPLGMIEEKRPYTYQGEKEVASAYRVRGDEVGFDIGAYDPEQPLIIDPDVKWSTYYGGSSEDWAYDVSTDAAGNVLVTGYTFSIDFPIENALQTATNDDYDDAFVIKLTPDGNRLWATYYGGSRDDVAVGIAVDATGNIAVVGRTGSTDFPIENAWQSSRGGAFAIRLNSAGQRLWATCLGSGNDAANGVATDRNGGVVVLGESWRSDFPVVNAYQSELRGAADIFIVRFDNSGNVLWSTYFGGTGLESYAAPWGCDAIAVDNNNNIIVGGTTTSNDLFTRTAFQSAPAGESECFITKFDGSGTPVWSTYYGGQSYEYTYSVTIDGRDHVLVCGATMSRDFPLQNAFQNTLSGPQDAFILKFNSAGQRMWSTYYGGSSAEEAYGIAVDQRENVFVTGWTDSRNFPVLGAFMASSGGGYDAFVLGFDRNGQRIWGTYFGGDDITWYEKGHGIATDRIGHITIVGATGSANLPMVNALQPVKSGSADAFIARFSCVIPKPETTPKGSIRMCSGDSVVISAAPGYSAYRWSNGASTASIVVRDAGIYTVVVDPEADCNSRSLPVTVEVLPRPAPRIIGPAVLCEGSHAFLRADKSYPSYSWARDAIVLSTEAQVDVSEAGTYTLTVTGENGCTGVATLVVTVRKMSAPQIVLEPVGLTELCPGDSVVLTVAEPFASYAWSNGATTASITVRTAGVYSLVVADENGCTSPTVLQEINVVQLWEEPIIGPQSSCRDSEELYGVQMQMEASYQWTITGGTIVENTPESMVRVRWDQTGPGTLTVTGSKGNCSITTTLTIVVADSLQPRIGGSLELCPGGSTQLYVEGVYDRYEWTGGITSPRLTVTTPGTYTVVVSNGAGCRGSTTVTVSVLAPQPVIRGAASVCPNSRMAYTAGSVGETSLFEWAVRGGTILSGHSTRSVIVQWGPGPVGDLTVKTREPQSPCETEAVLAVAIEAVLHPAITAVPAVACDGEPVVLSAGAGFTSYLWSTGETTASITVNTDGEYSVVVGDGIGCSGSTSAVVQYIMRLFAGNESIVWNDVEAGTTTYYTHTWTNNGAGPVRIESWEFVRKLPEFDVAFSPPLPADIPPGGSLEITVSFRPQKPGDYRDTLVVHFPIPCYESLLIDFRATSTAPVVSVSLPDTTAFPWQRDYQIPLYARVISGSIERAYTVEFEARMDASVFFPTGLTQGVITGNTVDAATGRRTITGRVENVVLNASGTLFTRIVGDVLLGERDNTVLTLERFELAGLPFADVETQDGMLTLEGICREGDARFVRSMEGFGITVYPHPVQDELVALVEVVEAGSCSLELYSADGRREVIREWIHTPGSDGAAIVRHDMGAKSAGVYWLVLRTPTQTGSTMVLFVK